MMPISVPLSYTAKKLQTPTVIKLVTFNSDLVVKSKLKRALQIDRLKRFYVRKVSKVVAISKFIENECESFGFDNRLVERIPNAVNTEKFAPLSLDGRHKLRTLYGFSPEDKIVLFVGALYERKQPVWVFDAVEDLQSEIENLKFLCVGPAKDTQYSKELVARCHDRDFALHIEFSDRVEELYALADVFCLPSIREGFANSVLESMSSQTLTISTEISGSSDIIKHGENGFFVHSQADITRILRECFTGEHDVGEIARNGRVAIEQAYSTSQVISLYKRLFLNLMKTRS
jgi:glycosyltransferase involved in cell wall biosynthesis